MKTRSKYACLAAAAALAACGPARQAFADAPSHHQPGFSLGGRGAYYDPHPDGADSSWFGGAQARWHIDKTWAAEGSIDYRHEKFEGDIDSHVYPVQASVLAYLLHDKPV